MHPIRENAATTAASSAYAAELAAKVTNQPSQEQWRHPEREENQAWDEAINRAWDEAFEHASRQGLRGWQRNEYAERESKRVAEQINNERINTVGSAPAPPPLDPSEFGSPYGRMLLSSEFARCINGLNLNAGNGRWATIPDGYERQYPGRVPPPKAPPGCTDYTGYEPQHPVRVPSPVPVPMPKVPPHLCPLRDAPSSSSSGGGRQPSSHNSMASPYGVAAAR